MRFKGLKNKFTFSVAALILFSGCASYRFPLIRPVSKLDKKSADRINAQDFFIQARDYDRRGETEMAEQYYKAAYDLDASSTTLKEELAKKYIESGKYSQALLLVKGSKSNKELTNEEKRLVATIYIKMGNFEKSSEVLEMLPDKSDEELYSLGLIYESVNNTEKALKYYMDYFKNNPQSIQMGYKIGKLLINQKRFAEAESLYQMMGAEVGENPDIDVMIGALQIVRGDTAKGLASFANALKIDSTHEDALRSTAQLYISKNDYSKAIFFYEKLYTNTNYGEVYGRTLAILYYYNKQYDNAEKLLNILLKDAIDDYELHYYMALVFEALKKNDLAVIEFEKTISIRNTFEDAWKELCYLSIREKKYENALEIAERFLKILPDASSAWKLKGYVLSAKKDYVKSIDSFVKALSIDSTDVITCFELGSAYERNNNIDKATMQFKKVLRIHPDDPATLNYLGFMWAEKGIQLDSAKVLIEKALKTDPDNGAFLDSYAWVFYQMGNIDSSYKYMELAVKKIDDDPVVFSHLGDILFKKNELKKALDAFQRSLDLDVEEPDKIRVKISDIENILKSNGNPK